MSTTEIKRAPVTPAFLLIMFVGGAVFMLGFIQIRRSWQARHPAVSEHRGELAAAAAEKMRCEPDALKIVVEEPTLARVEGCSRIATFRWGRVRGKGLPMHWHEIDPSCRFNFMGFDLPCQ